MRLESIDKTMRIAIVINTAWNIYNFRMGLIRSFLAKNYEIHTIAPADGYEGYLTEAGCQHHSVVLDNKGSNPKNDIHYIYQLYKVYRKVKPDVILHFTIKPNLYGTLAAKLLGIPVINNVSGLGTVFLRENRTSKIARTMYRYLFQFPEKVFFQNKDDLQYFIRQGLVKEEITALLPGSGVNINYFYPAPFARNRTFVFLLAARLIQDKGIREYAEAARILKKQHLNAQFWLVGFKDDSPFGIDESTLQRWKEEGLVDYKGSTDTIRDVIRLADCVVLPSYREGTPRSLLEAASMGKPLVATNVPGCIEVVENGVNGFLCESHNAEDLASQMAQMMLLDDEALEKMGRASRQKIENTFDENLVIQKYQKAVAEILHVPQAKKQTETVAHY